MSNLGNQKIKDTYQLVLQTDAGGNLQRLDGSTPNPFIINQNLRYLDGTTHPSGYVLTSNGSGYASWGAVSFSGDVYISGGSIEGTTIELNASSGGTISIPGLKWSANTDGSISTSGVTDVKISADTYVGGDIIGTSGNTKITNNVGGYVEAKSNHANYGLIIRDYDSDEWGNISANEGNLRLNYSTYAANKGIFITEPTTGTQMVGINDATPSYTLDVNGDARVTDNLTVNVNNFFVDSSIGKVGVGTGIPDARLTVSGTSDGIFTTYPLGGGGATPLGRFTLQLNSNRLVFDAPATTGALSNGDKVRVTDSNDTTWTLTILEITSSSNALTSNAYQGVSITNATSGLLYDDGTSGPPVLFKTYSGDSVSFQVSGMTIMSGSTDMLDIFASSSITNQDVYWSANTDGSISNSGLTGNVGIGTTAPTEKLQVDGNVKISLTNGGNLQFRNGSTANVLFSNSYNIIGASGSKTDFNTYVYGNNPYSIWTNNTNRLNVTGTGNVGIGTTVPNQKLTVSGTISGDSTMAATTYNSTTSIVGYKLNGAKYLWISNSDLQVGNVSVDTDIIGTSINLQTETTINDNLTVTGNTNISGNTEMVGNLSVVSVTASTSVISPLISANTVQGSYSVIPFNGNTAALVNDNWKYPGTNGISNPAWGYDSGTDGLVTGTTVIPITRTKQMSGISLPAGTRIIGIEGVIRSSINDIAYAGLFTYTPDYGGPDSVNATLRMLATSSKNGQSNVANDPQRFKIYPDEIHQYVISDGEQLLPAFRKGGTISANQTVIGNYTIIVKY